MEEDFIYYLLNVGVIVCMTSIGFLLGVIIAIVVEGSRIGIGIFSAIIGCILAIELIFYMYKRNRQ
jgi:hypothetical protein